MCAVSPRKTLLFIVHASTNKMKVPVVHVRGLILLFFSHGAHTEIYDSRRALYDDFSVSRHLHQIIIRCIRGAEKAFRRPYKLPLRTFFCPLE